MYLLVFFMMFIKILSNFINLCTFKVQLGTTKYYKVWNYDSDRKCLLSMQRVFCVRGQLLILC